jgi:hypothetical protein
LDREEKWRARFVFGSQAPIDRKEQISSQLSLSDDSLPQEKEAGREKKRILNLPHVSKRWEIASDKFGHPKTPRTNKKRDDLFQAFE